MNKRVVTFGEIMLRLAPNGYYRFFQNDQLQATFGGGEANVAVSLANYGLDSVYVTKLPSHAIGQAAVNALRSFGVDTSHIVRGGDRVGIYFLEKGASQRGSVCIYDRAHSAIQEAQPADFDWDAIFAGADWHHARSGPQCGGDLQGRLPGSQGQGSQDLLRSELPGQAVDPGAGPGGHE